jgi:hypothetical protein
MKRPLRNQRPVGPFFQNEQSSNQIQIKENAQTKIVKGETYLVLIKHNEARTRGFREIREFLEDRESYKEVGTGEGEMYNPTGSGNYGLDATIFEAVEETNATTIDIENAIMEDIPSDRTDVVNVKVQRLRLVL